MYKLILKNDKSFYCDANTTIFEAAKASGILLEHSCLAARCRSCIVKVIEGSTQDKVDDLVLSANEKTDNFTLSCNAFPTSNLVLDVEDLTGVEFYEKKIVPAKIQAIETITTDVIKIQLRLPPRSNFKYNSGQYVNIIKGSIKRSYSVANAFQENTFLEFFIKKYENGLMSKYWFNEAKVNDLLRLEGPLGSFFLRESDKKNIILLATGTGIAPIKAILEKVSKNKAKYSDKIFWLFFGARFSQDIFWEPADFEGLNLEYVKVLSRETSNFDGFKGYVQDAVLNANIDLADAQVYACGSNDMIESAKELLTKNNVSENNFFSDAFICTN
jgi:CDP-4-dehydro-6-deoxyglucose reductase